MVALCLAQILPVAPLSNKWLTMPTSRERPTCARVSIRVKHSPTMQLANALKSNLWWVRSIMSLLKMQDQEQELSIRIFRKETHHWQMLRCKGDCSKDNSKSWRSSKENRSVIWTSNQVSVRNHYSESCNHFVLATLSDGLNNQSMASISSQNSVIVPGEKAY